MDRRRPRKRKLKTLLTMRRGRAWRVLAVLYILFMPIYPKTNGTFVVKRSNKSPVVTKRVTNKGDFGLGPHPSRAAGHAWPDLSGDRHPSHHRGDPPERISKADGCFQQALAELRQRGLVTRASRARCSRGQHLRVPWPARQSASRSRSNLWGAGPKARLSPSLILSSRLI